MVVYEVTVRVAPDAYDALRAWLDGHIAEILRLDGFVSAALYALAPDGLGPDSDGWPRLVVHYVLTDQAALDRYLDHDAPRMRADGVARFGDRFAASRRVLALEAVFDRAGPPGWSKA